MSDTLQSEGSAVQQVVGGRYQILRLLGRGGMGSVYAATNTWTRRQVALKMLHPEVAANGENVQRFMVEAQAAAKIKHPNILDVLDMGRDETSGVVFLITEFLDGEDLARRLKARGRLPPREAMEILLPVAEALVAAHDLGIIHRDLKPENIFLAATAGGVTPKVIDFGISKILDAKTSGMQHTRTGTVLGTPFYMSPEQAQGDAVVDVRTDVWSLGVVLFEALSAKRPYVAPNYNALVARLLLSEPLRLDAVAPDLPADLVAVVHGALQRDPDRRFPTMRAFLDALRACAVVADGSGDAERVSGPVPIDPRRRRRSVLVGTAAGVALVAALGITLVLKPSASESHVQTRGAGVARPRPPAEALRPAPEGPSVEGPLAEATQVPRRPAVVREAARSVARTPAVHRPPARGAAPPPAGPARQPDATLAAPAPAPHSVGANGAPITED